MACVVCGCGLGAGPSPLSPLSPPSLLPITSLETCVTKVQYFASNQVEQTSMFVCNKESL